MGQADNKDLVGRVRPMKEREVHIAGICGSMRGAESYTRKLLVCVMAELEARGARTDMLDLADMDLPLCKSPRDTADNPDTTALRTRIGRADGIVLATPEYHNSFSGVLKNALDLLQYDQLEHKMFGLIGIAGGDLGAVHALSHLRTVVRGVGGHCIPQQISLPSVYRHFDGDRLTEAEIQERVEEFAQYMLLHTLRLKDFRVPAPGVL